MTIPGWLTAVLARQYARTMRDAYAFARSAASAGTYVDVLDCGSGSGHERAATFGAAAATLRYTGLEWCRGDVDAGCAAGLALVEADLNRSLPIADASQDRVIAFSVLEHLLMPCAFLAECHRVLRPGGRLVLLTPNISTYFTALQVLSGRMPTSGPHPDSNALLASVHPASLSGVERDDVSGPTPQHRHLVVFSFRELRQYLRMAGFREDVARGFGYYPFPVAFQRLFERIDPGHCHQMVIACTKPGGRAAPAIAHPSSSASTIAAAPAQDGNGP